MLTYLIYAYSIAQTEVTYGVDYANLPILITVESAALDAFTQRVTTTLGPDAADAVKRFGRSVLLNAGINEENPRLVPLNSGKKIEELIPSLEYVEHGGVIRPLMRHSTLQYAIARRDDGTHCLVMTEASSGTRATIVFEPYKDGAVVIQNERVSHFDPLGRRTSPLTTASRALRPHPAPSPAPIQ